MTYLLIATYCFYSAQVQGGPDSQEEDGHLLNVPSPAPLLPNGRYLYSLFILLYLSKVFHIVGP